MISDFKPQLRALRFLLYEFYNAQHLKNNHPLRYWKTLYHISIYSASFLFIIAVKKGLFPQSAIDLFGGYVEQKFEEGQEGLIDIWDKEIRSLGRWYFETNEPLTPFQKLYIDSIIQMAEDYSSRNLPFNEFEPYNGVYLLNVFGAPLPEFTEPGQEIEINGMYFTEGVANLSLDEPLFLTWADYIYFAGVVKRAEGILIRTNGVFTPEDLEEYQDESLEASYAANDVYIKLNGLIADPPLTQDPVGELSSNLQQLNF